MDACTDACRHACVCAAARIFEGCTKFRRIHIYIYIYEICVCLYFILIYIFIYMVTPPRSTPASSTRFHCLLLCIGPLLIYAENTVNADTIVLFAMSSACFLRRSAVGLSAEVLS